MIRLLWNKQVKQKRNNVQIEVNYKHVSNTNKNYLKLTK